jgi:hypothetical protein
LSVGCDLRCQQVSVLVFQYGACPAFEKRIWKTKQEPNEKQQQNGNENAFPAFEEL